MFGQVAYTRFRPDGSQYRVTGFVMTPHGRECPVDKCGALCCQVASPFKGLPCRYLTGELQCEIHQNNGASAKPFGCAVFPMRQKDIDDLNARSTNDKKCLLTVEELKPAGG